MIVFYLDPRSGLAPYLQLVQQVKSALRLGMLEVGDQLPTIKQVIAELAINPNTVQKAYRELEHAGLVGSRPGQGTFVINTLAGPSLKSQEVLRRSLGVWLGDAIGAGMDEESMQALFMDALRESLKRGIA